MEGSSSRGVCGAVAAICAAAARGVGGLGGAREPVHGFAALAEDPFEQSAVGGGGERVAQRARLGRRVSHYDHVRPNLLRVREQRVRRRVGVEPEQRARVDERRRVLHFRTVARRAEGDVAEREGGGHDP